MQDNVDAHWIIERIEDLRCDRDMTAAELIREARPGIDKNPTRHWDHYRHGRNTLPTVQFLEKVLAVFGKKLEIVDA